jgi:crotonobetainyl-CoA:carnitine CoA-transferase CaiB-like acyl-CoA transferase
VNAPAALAGLRVVDLSTVIAGPNCARYLADFGADVIKIEQPGGDSLRRIAWQDARDGEGMWWKLANRNKRTVVLDLKDPADRALVLDIAAEADVLVENFRPLRLEKLGLAPDVLHGDAGRAALAGPPARRRRRGDPPLGMGRPTELTPEAIWAGSSC